MQAHASLVRCSFAFVRAIRESWRDEAASTIAEAMAGLREGGRPRRPGEGLAAARVDAGHCAVTSGTPPTHPRVRSSMPDSRETSAGGTRLPPRLRQQRSSAQRPSPMPSDVAKKTLEQHIGDRQAEAAVRSVLASLLAMEGSFDRAREEVTRRSTIARGSRHACQAPSRSARSVASRDARRDDPWRPNSSFAMPTIVLDQLGEKYFLSTVAGLLAQTLYSSAAIDEVERLGQIAEELASDDDIDTQALWRCVRGKVLARLGSFDGGRSPRHGSARAPRADRCRDLSPGALCSISRKSSGSQEMRRLLGRRSKLPSSYQSSRAAR